MGVEATSQFDNELPTSSAAARSYRVRASLLAGFPRSEPNSVRP